MIIICLIYMFLIFHLSSFSSNFFNRWSVVISVKIVLNKSKNYIKLHFKFKYTLILEHTQFLLHISTKHRTSDKWQGPADRVGLYLNTVVNQPASGKLQQSTTVSSQRERFYYPWMWLTLYFDWWPHFEKCPVIVYPIKCKKNSLRKAPSCFLPS